MITQGLLSKRIRDEIAHKNGSCRRIRRRTESPERIRPEKQLSELPPRSLLLSLPGIFLQGPENCRNPDLLYLSYVSLKACFLQHTLSPDLECRVWTGLGELAICVIIGELADPQSNGWANELDDNAERYVSRGLLVAQKHASLRPYWIQLNLLQARLSTLRGRHKSARSVLQQLLKSLSSTDNPASAYSAYLVYVEHLVAPQPAHSRSAKGLGQDSCPSPNLEDIRVALSALESLRDLAHGDGNENVVLLTYMMRLGIMLTHGLWDLVASALDRAEASLGLSYVAKNNGADVSNAAAISASTADGASSKAERTSPRTPTAAKNKPTDPETFITFGSPFEGLMAAHTLFIGVTYFVHIGDNSKSKPRLSHLHSLLDSGVLNAFPEGHVELQLTRGPPLSLRVASSRILFALGFLTSATSKRDSTGKRPKRQVFAKEGLQALSSDYISGAAPAFLGDAFDVHGVEHTLHGVKADLFLELVGVYLSRSEFEAAEETLEQFIAHTRTYALFPRYACRIALHYAHLAHARGDYELALKCYDAAAFTGSKSDPDSKFAVAAAKVGSVLLRLGLSQGTSDEDLRESAEAAVLACQGLGSSLEMLSEILQSCFSSEILKSKQHLKNALVIATRAQDNHSRALILALVATQYTLTAPDYAHEILLTADRIGAGLGVSNNDRSRLDGQEQKERNDESRILLCGNVALRLWIGERKLDLYRRSGKHARADKQLSFNRELSKVFPIVPLGRST